MKFSFSLFAILMIATRVHGATCENAYVKVDIPAALSIATSGDNFNVYSLISPVTGSITAQTGWTLTTSTSLTLSTQAPRVVYHAKKDDGTEVDVTGTNILNALKVELFRDEGCTKILDDWSVEPGKPRSPKYLFGSGNGIFVQVTGPSGLGNSYFTVKVSSEADTTGIHLHLHETSPGMYRNRNASGSEVLYLDKTTHVGTWNDIYLKMLEEEVLTFTLKGSGAEIYTTDVKVDRAEIGAEWQSDYKTYDTFPTVNNADECAIGFFNGIGDISLIISVRSKTQ